MRYRFSVGVALVLCATLCVPKAHAQSDSQQAVEASEAQLELNQQGVEAIVEEDYMRAVRLFNASLDLGELNITYLNMARAYQHAGECEQAEKNYVAALEAPKLAEPSPAQIAEVVHTYRQELRETCHGRLVLECTPEEITVFIDGQGPQACDGEPMDLEKGTYTVRGELEGHTTETTVAITPMTTARVSLSLARAPEVTETREVDELDEPHRERVDRQRQQDQEPEVDRAVTPPPEPESVAQSPSNKSTYWLVGSGVTLAGGVALDVLPASARNGQLDAMDFAPVGLYALGTGALVYGIKALLD